MTSQVPQLIRPKPRRPFQTSPPQASSPSLATPSPDESLSRSYSILNLTSSTLFGIYSRTDYQNDRDESSTPWGTGAESPLLLYSSASSLEPPSSSHLHRRKSSVPPTVNPNTTSSFVSLGLRSILLCGIGMLYGLLLRHLHDDRQLAPFQVEGMIKLRNDWGYLAFWGISGVALGTLLPWVDGLWEENFESDIKEVATHSSTPEPGEEELDSTSLFGADWTPVVRSIGAFAGIAFAIRKLPWASGLQASLTLFLFNPVLWYVIDRSKPGFLLSSSVGAVGSALLLASNPEMMPSPKAPLHLNSTGYYHSLVGDDMGGLENYVRRESLEGGIWILSVLFCSCVCFGNVGRRLALSEGPAGRGKERERSLAMAARVFKAENGPGKFSGRH